MNADIPLEVVFYRTESGNEPVRAWLQGLNKQDKKTIGGDIKTVQYGWPIGLSGCLSCEKWIPDFGKSDADLIRVLHESCLR
jgi:hypothetical protein